MDDSSETLGKKIRNASKQKIPHVLVIGEKEQASDSVTLRRYGVEEQTTLPAAEFEAQILQKIQSRSLD
jgi:threonyl-tRNA synthetase